MRILVAEDENDTAEFIKRGLGELGHNVLTVGNGTDALHLLSTEPFDVAIVDRMLPGLDGVAVVRRARAEDVDTPVLILTALGRIEDRVTGLEAGADDYLVKPFAFSEMLARVDALTRRSAVFVKDTVLRVGDLELDLLTRSVRRAGREVELLPREFKLLEYLMRNVGQVVSRGMLLQHVWDLHFDPMTNVIDVYVGRLRRKIDSAGSYPLIHTVRGVGFCLRAPG